MKKTNRLILIIITLILFSSLFCQVLNSNHAYQNCSCISSTEKDKIGSINTNVGWYNSTLPNPLFTIEAITCNSTMQWTNPLFGLQEALEALNIAVNIHLLSWLDFLNEILSDYNFDITYLHFQELDPYTPDMSYLYSEAGSINLVGYETSLDWNTSLGNGENEWYLEQGLAMMPPDSSERIQHYWNWQQYLMNEILPVIPGFIDYYREANWANLAGYNYSKGVFQSWGKMSWSGLHPGQSSSNEFVTCEDSTDWDELNPLFLDGFHEKFISNAITDPLVWFDPNEAAYPHIISSWSHINDTHVRLTVREGIKWQVDPDSLFPTEYVDVRDVYFTLFCQRNIGHRTDQFDWIDDMEIIDDYTLDIYIDDILATTENDLTDTYLRTLETNLIPEHYLNQTQEIDGITPDTSHSSWSKYSTQAFGTGLFELSSHTVGAETVLTNYSDCWRLNTTITADPALDWNRRFGDFSSGLDTLRVLNFSADNALAEFEKGNLDKVYLFEHPEKINEFETNASIDVKSKLQPKFHFYGFNLREARGTPLQDRSVCPNNPDLTVGLAVRKAIAYAVNKTKINEDYFNGDYYNTEHPLSATSGVWLNPNIIKYEYNLTKAKEYLYYAGFETGLDSDGDGLTDLYETETSLTDRHDSDTDDDGLTDGEEVNTYFTDPLDTDSDDDGLTDYEEILLGTDPNDDDSDDDGLTDFEEENTYSTDPNDSDTDDDGLTDYEEVNLGLDGYITDPNDEDTDNDGILDGEEVVAGVDGYVTDPTNFDTDSDGLIDSEEVTFGSDGYLTDPTDSDSDDDGVPDNIEMAYHTNPNSPDTDSDLMPDRWEILYSLNPLIDDSILDADNDGLYNLLEYTLASDPTDPDTDDDELSDGDEYAYGTDPTLSDTDADGMPDGWEVENGLIPVVDDSASDADSDDLTNLEEYHYETDPNEADTDGDSFTDGEEVTAGTDPLDPDDFPTTEETGLVFPITIIFTSVSLFALLLYSKKNQK